MDLSLKKPAAQPSQDLPQDLSVKKPRVPATHPDPDPDPDPPSRGTPTTRLREPSVARTVADPRTRTTVDQYPRTDVDLKPRTFADPNLRSLAHQKAITLAGRTKRTAPADLKPSELVIPKPSALIIPNPRTRTIVDQRNRAHVRQSGSGTLAAHKSRTPHRQAQQQQQQQQSSADETKPSQQVLDLRKKPTGSRVAVVAASDRSPSRRRDQPENASTAASDNSYTLLRNPSPSRLSNGCSSSSSNNSDSGGSIYGAGLPSEDPNLSKRRRKQERPRKRIKLDSYLPEEVDPAYLISQEFLDKVTDAAAAAAHGNGRLRAGLGAYFGGDAAQAASDFDGSDIDGAENGLSDFAQNSLLKDDNDGDDGDADGGGGGGGSSSPATSPDGSRLSHGFHKASHRSKKLMKEARVSTSLQNREKRKALRLYGKAYTTPSGKTYPQRRVRDKDCSKCRYNCSVNISARQRQAIFEHFWSLDSYVKRLYYYCQSIKEKPAKTMKHTRECSREYTFLVSGERVRVCKGFYLATLDVSDKAVRIAMEKRKRGKGMWDKRGAHPPHNKTRPEDKDRVRSHIESFLIIDIYTKTCADSSSTITPGQDLNVTKMHQDYALECQEEGREPVSEDVYRKTFNTEYNLTTVQV